MTDWKYIWLRRLVFLVIFAAGFLCGCFVEAVIQ